MCRIAAVLHADFGVAVGVGGVEPVVGGDGGAAKITHGAGGCRICRGLLCWWWWCGSSSACCCGTKYVRLRAAAVHRRRRDDHRARARTCHRHHRAPSPDDVGRDRAIADPADAQCDPPAAVDDAVVVVVGPIELLSVRRAAMSSASTSTSTVAAVVVLVLVVVVVLSHPAKVGVGRRPAAGVVMPAVMVVMPVRVMVVMPFMVVMPDVMVVMPVMMGESSVALRVRRLQHCIARRVGEVGGVGCRHHGVRPCVRVGACVRAGGWVGGCVWVGAVWVGECVRVGGWVGGCGWVRACVRACVRAFVCVCVRACVSVCAGASSVRTRVIYPCVRAGGAGRVHRQGGVVIYYLYDAPWGRISISISQRAGACARKAWHACLPACLPS